MLFAPAASEILDASIAFTADGSATVAVSRGNPDNRDGDAVITATLNPLGRRGTTRRLPGALELLALGSGGRGPVLVSGAGRSGLRVAPGQAGADCCRAADARAIGRDGRAARPHRLLRSVASPLTAEVTGLPGGALLTLASHDAVWAAEQGARGVGRVRRLSDASDLPGGVAAAVALRTGAPAVAWSTGTAGQPELGADTLREANGGPHSAPAHPHTVRLLAPGHQIDGLAMADSASAPTLGWIEDWYDPAGAFHSLLQLLTLGGSAAPVGHGSARQVLGALRMVGNGAGDVAAVVRACTRYGRCDARVSLGSAGRSPGALRVIGPIDPGTGPAVAMLEQRTALLVWLSRGDVLVRRADLAHARLGPVITLYRGGDATDLRATSPAAGDRALIVWAAGTTRPALLGRLFAPGA